MRLLSSCVGFLALGVMTSQSQSAAQAVLYTSPLFQNSPASQKVSTPVSYKPEEKCLSDAYMLFGKAWAPGWVDGGLTRSANSLGAREPEFNEIFRFNQALSFPAGRTSLLIIDHFRPVEVSLGSAEPGLTVSHGDLVLAHTRKILEDQKFVLNESPSRSDSIYSSYVYELKDRVITIRTFNLSYYRDDDKYGLVKISKVLNDLNSFVGGKSHTEVFSSYKDNESVVINMSFSMIPCEAAVAFRNYKDNIDATPGGAAKPKKYMDGFLKELRIKNSYMADWSDERILQYILSVDPGNILISTLRNSILNLRKDRIALAVAASGNYGLNIDTFPARMNEVISVGAVDWTVLESIKTMANGVKTPSQPDDPFIRFYWSNLADVYSAGGWFSLSPSDLNRYCGNVNVPNCVFKTGTPIPDQFGYRGTSFSAPSVAAYLALRNNPSPCYPRNTLMGFQFQKTATPAWVELKPYHGVMFKKQFNLLLSEFC